MQKKNFGIVGMIIVLILIPSSVLAGTSIPSWIKNNAKWWANGQIGDSDFTKGIEYLINQGIINVSQTKSGSVLSHAIPVWIKNDARWWSEGQINDSEFVRGMGYLVQVGVINVATHPRCDESLWDHIYNLSRLEVIDDCKTVSGMIDNITVEKDGDYHIRLNVDPQYAYLINDANVQWQHGDLVVEPICQNPVEQDDAVAACQNFYYHVDIPPVGTHVQVTGSYVLDHQHDGWAEIHPVTSILVIPSTEVSASINEPETSQPSVSTQSTNALHLDLKGKEVISRGSTQSITLFVTDGTNPVSGAYVSVHIEYASGNIAKNFAGLTDSNGQYNFSWKIDEDSTPGTFTVNVATGKDGYSIATGLFSFKVTAN